jgi:hypothetical protein
MYPATQAKVLAFALAVGKRSIGELLDTWASGEPMTSGPLLAKAESKAESQAESQAESEAKMLADARKAWLESRKARV